MHLSEKKIQFMRQNLPIFFSGAVVTSLGLDKVKCLIVSDALVKKDLEMSSKINFFYSINASLEFTSNLPRLVEVEGDKYDSSILPLDMKDSMIGWTLQPPNFLLFLASSYHGTFSAYSTPGDDRYRVFPYYWFRSHEVDSVYEYTTFDQIILLLDIWDLEIRRPTFGSKTLNVRRLW